VRRPRVDIDLQAGPDEVERTAAAATARISVLAPDGIFSFEDVRVRIDVDQRAETRVRDRAVVALEVVLHGDLPVRVERVVDTLSETGRRRVERQPSARQRLGRGDGTRIRCDEDERTPELEPERYEAEPGGLEPPFPVSAWCRAEAAVQSVRPGVV